MKLLDNTARPFSGKPDPGLHRRDISQAVGEGTPIWLMNAVDLQISWQKITSSVAVTQLGRYLRLSGFARKLLTVTNWTRFVLVAVRAAKSSASSRPKSV